MYIPMCVFRLHALTCKVWHVSQISISHMYVMYLNIDACIEIRVLCHAHIYALRNSYTQIPYKHRNTHASGQPYAKYSRSNTGVKLPIALRGRTRTGWAGKQRWFPGSWIVVINMDLTTVTLMVTSGSWWSIWWLIIIMVRCGDWECLMVIVNSGCQWWLVNSWSSSGPAFANAN